LFLWLARHDRLMTSANRFTRGLTDDPRCKGSLNGEENVMHVLRDCKLASEIWNHLVPAHRQPSFFNLPLKDWISMNLDKANQREENWATTFATTMWWLWKWRNKRCFENPDFNQPQAWDFIRTRAKEIATAFNTSTPPYKATGE